MKDGGNDTFGVGSLLKGLGKFIDIMADIVENQEDSADINGTFNDNTNGKKISGSYSFYIRLGADNIEKMKERVNVIQDNVSIDDIETNKVLRITDGSESR